MTTTITRPDAGNNNELGLARTSTPTTPVVLGVEEILRRLAKEVGESKFQRYFTGQTRLELVDNRLNIIVASGFLAQFLGRQFGENIRRAAAAPQGSPMLEVHFLVDRAAFEQGGSAAAPQPAEPPRAVPKQRPVAPRPQARFRLDNFIVGTSNRLAHGAAMRLIEDDQAVSPLFIHGSCGLGKTHLLHAIVTGYQERRPTAIVRYTSAEVFTNEYITAVRTDKIDAFRKAYRKVDLLCIDDVHFFSNKEGTQSELLHTFDAVGLDGARVVLASDEHPREIRKLSEKLVSRFMAGAVVKIDTPDNELRARLIRHIASARTMKVDEPALALLVDRSARSVGSLGGFGGSVREIEGLLNQVEAIHRLLPDAGSVDGVIGIGLVRRALGLSGAEERSMGPAPALRPRKPIAAQLIVGEVCRSLAVDLSDFMGKGRHPRVVLARSLTSFICRKLTTLSFPEIARAMGRGNHSTIITAHRRIERDLAVAKPEPLTTDLAPHHAGLTLGELVDALSKQVARASSGM